MGKETGLSRREFLKFFALSSARAVIPFSLVPAGVYPEHSRGTRMTGKEEEPSEAPSIEFGEFVQTSGRFEPERIYPIEHSFPLVRALYEMKSGKISFATEAELLSQLQGVVMRPDKNFFLSFDGQTPIPYRLIKTINLDPALQGGKFHWGMDFDSSDPQRGTLMTTVFASKFIDWDHYATDAGRTIPRLGPHSAITQLVDSKGQDIEVKLWDKEFFIFALYGHIRIPREYAQGQILPVGTIIGDITRIPLPQTPVHTHLEIVMVEKHKLSTMTLHEILVLEEYNPKVANAYLDSTLFWKFLPGDILANTGKTQTYFDVTSSYEERKRYE